MKVAIVIMAFVAWGFLANWLGYRVGFRDGQVVQKFKRRG